MLWKSLKSLGFLEYLRVTRGEGEGKGREGKGRGKGKGKRRVDWFLMVT